MRILRILGFPIAVIYGLAVYVRNVFYDKGWIVSSEFSTPTICVGNLSLGGTGKTPMIEYLVRLLSKEHSIAVVSRGYKRKSTGFQLASETSNALQLGDEPFQIYTKFPEITVAVDSNRANGISTLEKLMAPDVILLDDAFQHRKVTSSIHILLTAYDNLFYDDFYLPTGTLRDAKNQKKRADIIVVTKCPKDIDKAEMDAIVAKMKTAHPVYFTYLRYNKCLLSHTGKESYAYLNDKKIGLVTGIANPLPLLEFLDNQGVEYTHHKFLDHHFFSKKELDSFKKYDVVLTTEKDYMRFGTDVSDVFYVEVCHEFIATEKQGFANILKEKLRNYLVD